MTGYGGWMSCTPNNNAEERHSNHHYFDGQSGSTPGFSGTLNNFNGWYHLVHTFAKVGSKWRSKLYLNNKLCVMNADGEAGYTHGDAPNIAKYADYGRGCDSCKSPACTPTGGNEDCGGPTTGWPGPHWQYPSGKEIAFVRYFPATELDTEQITALHDSEKNRNDCLKNNEASCQN